MVNHGIGIFEKSILQVSLLKKNKKLSNLKHSVVIWGECQRHQEKKTILILLIETLLLIGWCTAFCGTALFNWTDVAKVS